ncbi:hypothetical protein PoB_004050200 [Plakobranchus ocellatus]|uniref:Uncharacterized protein n=1 Tax=Plakobranchus ocellatus TaxID=259542 RepID=A0AAV4B4F1_9GAST|nr:hypothetical protein PoB_004050200 [Plakobranchus ocellatus]
MDPQHLIKVSASANFKQTTWKQARASSMMVTKCLINRSHQRHQHHFISACTKYLKTPISSASCTHEVEEKVLSDTSKSGREEDTSQPYIVLT